MPENGVKLTRQIGTIGIALSCGLVAPVTAAAAETLRLENTHIAVDIDADNGGIRSIRDKQREVTYQVPGIGFAITTDAGAVRSEKARTVKQSSGEAELEFAAGGLEVGLHFRLRPDDRFIEKWLVIRSAGGKPYFLKEVVMEDVTAAASFSTIHFHDDQTNWHCPINFFLRGDNGGCFAGLEYLKVKRDLFDCPGYAPVDGSAHVIGDRGFLFLFPGGFDRNITRPKKTVRASIPLNRWLGLKEDRSAVYHITEVYPQPGTERGFYRYGDDFLHDMPKDSAVILSLTPAPAGRQPQPATSEPGDDVIVVKAFPSRDG